MEDRYLDEQKKRSENERDDEKGEIFRSEIWRREKRLK